MEDFLDLDVDALAALVGDGEAANDTDFFATSYAQSSNESSILCSAEDKTSSISSAGLVAQLVPKSEEAMPHFDKTSSSTHVTGNEVMDDVGSKKEIIRGKAKAPTLSALLKGEDESDNEEKKAAEKAAYAAMLDEAEKVSSDPKEQKKQRRLIRNRMSAQLHRERKKAYIDKLEAEVRLRDGTIEALRRENLQLRKALAFHRTLPEVDSLLDSSACIGEEMGNTSEGSSSDGVRTPPPPPLLSKKRSQSPSWNSDKSKMSRIAAHSSLILAVCCLAIFRLPFWVSPHLSIANKPSLSSHLQNPAFPAWPVSDHKEDSQNSQQRDRMDAEHVDEEDTSFFRHRPGGRVLMSLADRHDGENFDDPKQETEDSLALSIVRAPLAADIRTRKRKSLPGHGNHQLLNTSYFFCPQTIQTVEDTRRMELKRLMNSTLVERRRLSRSRRQRENFRSKQAMPDAKSIVPLPRRFVGEMPVRGEASMAVTNMLVKKQSKEWEDDYADENATESIGGQLIVRNLVGYNVVDRQAHTERHPDSDSDSNTPYLMLIVPSSSLEGFSGASSQYEAQANSWVEVGCSMKSARFVDFR